MTRAEFEIKRLGHLGDGIADGPLYAQRVLPGEVVSAIPIGDQLSDVKIITPSEHRIKPACPSYKTCGGCNLHHVADEFVTEWKWGVVASALAAHDIAWDRGWVHSSPPQSRRRAKLAGRRQKNGARVGFHMRGSDEIAQITGCQILSPRIQAAIPALERLTVLLASRKSRLAFWVLDAENGLDIAVDGAGALGLDLRQNLAVWIQQADVLRLTVDEEIIGQEHPPILRFGDVPVAPPPRAFTQATPGAERALQRHCDASLPDAKSIVDLFAGAGTLSLPLAARARIDAFESEQDLLSAMDRGVAHATGIKAVQTHLRDLFRNPIITADLAGFDGAIIDPPRAGAAAQMAQLAASDIPNIAMVSCNPQSFSRDARMLIAEGYKMGPVNLVDQFRWSAHIELASNFSK